MLQLPPLSLYLHIPWCARKCPYCDFNSHKAGANLPEKAYVEALKQDLTQSLHLTQGRRLGSVFIGGGTPSLFSPESIAGILDFSERSVGFESDIEITMEANPGTFEQEKFKGFHSAGVNRLSIGIQSFSDLQLQQLGRIHGRSEALAAVAMAKQAGFSNINLDLMHGLPQQTPVDSEQDLATAINLEPAHISWYQLTVEPNTEFYSHPPELPLDDALAEIQERGEEQLAAAGFRQYEISAYARSGRTSRHNLNYWQFGDYLGIGAGAHGKITLPSEERIIRLQKTRQPDHYLDITRPFTSQEMTVATSELPLEFMMNALRLVNGVESGLFSARTGLSRTAINLPVAKLQQRNLLLADRDRISTTPTGSRFLNQVLAEFMTEQSS